MTRARHAASSRANRAASLIALVAVFMVVGALLAAFIPADAGHPNGVTANAPAYGDVLHPINHARTPQPSVSPSKTYPAGTGGGGGSVAYPAPQGFPAPSRTYPAPPPKTYPPPPPSPTPLPNASDLPPPIQHGSIQPGVVADDHVANWNALVGKQAQLTVHYVSMSSTLAPSLIHSIFRVDQGAEPVIELMPDKIGMLGNIPGGTKDKWLSKFNDEINAIGRPIVISFAPEMNGRWYAWGMDPGEFVPAWHHVQSVVNSPLVTWMWQPSASQAGGTNSTADILPYWPGSSSVAWVGLDGYYYKMTDTFQTIFGNSLNEVIPFGKPTLVSETAVTQTDVITGKPMDRAGKINDLVAGVVASHLAGMIYYDLMAPPDGSPYHQDFRIDNDAAALAAYKTGVSSW